MSVLIASSEQDQANAVIGTSLLDMTGCRAEAQEADRMRRTRTQRQDACKRQDLSTEYQKVIYTLAL